MQAVGVGPFAAVGMAVVGLVLQNVGVGERQERNLAQPVLDRGGRPNHAARGRATADVHLLAESDLETQFVGDGLRPEDVASPCACHSCNHEAIDLILFDACAVEQRLQHLADQDEDIAVAFLHDLGFGIGHDRVVAQSHCSLPEF